MSIRLFRCLDVWIEVLNHFEISLEHDKPGVIKEKRKMLLTVALVSRELTELGLDALWRNMTTLRPVVYVANSQEPFLEYYPSEAKDSGKRCWRLFPMSDITEPFKRRIVQYLKRIRKFHVRIYEPELELWQILHAFLAPHTIPYLLPRLKTLRLIPPTTTSRVSFLGVISYIFTPTVTSITMEGIWSPRSWYTIQNLMGSHHLPNLSELFYFNLGTRSLPSSTLRFTGLRHLIYRQSNTYIPIREFYYLNRLKKLSLNVCANPDDEESSTIFPELEDLQLELKSAADFGSIFWCLRTPALKSLSFTIRTGWNERLPLELITSGCTRLQHLEIICDPWGKHEYEGTMDDFMDLIELSAMKSFKLIDVPHLLTENDIYLLVGEWLELHTLVIRAPQTMFLASVLFAVSQFSAPRYLELPLDFSLLTGDLSSEQMMLQSHSPMLEIVSSSTKGIPRKGSEKLLLIRNLLHLFPNLQVLRGGEDIEELQDLLEGLRRTFYHTVESIES